MERFAFTVKDNRRDTTDYEMLWDSWHKKGCIINCKYPELDVKGRLHFHGIVTIPVKCYRKALCPKGFHFLLKPISDEEGWISYIKKDQSEDEDTNDNDFIAKITTKLFH